MGTECEQIDIFIRALKGGEEDWKRISPQLIKIDEFSRTFGGFSKGGVENSLESWMNRWRDMLLFVGQRSQLSRNCLETFFLTNFKNEEENDGIN